MFKDGQDGRQSISAALDDLLVLYEQLAGEPSCVLRSTSPDHCFSSDLQLQAPSFMQFVRIHELKLPLAGHCKGDATEPAPALPQDVALGLADYLIAGLRPPDTALLTSRRRVLAMLKHAEGREAGVGRQAVRTRAAQLQLQHCACVSARLIA